MLNIQLPPKRSAFLWGPRKTGKTYWINKNYAESPLIDLLKTDIFADYASQPSLLRERYLKFDGLLVIDEIQMVPDLLNEIHWMIENAKVSFLMTGSSARKLRRGHANLLAGRAWRYSMTPHSLTWKPKVLTWKRSLFPDFYPPTFFLSIPYKIFGPMSPTI